MLGIQKLVVLEYSYCFGSHGNEPVTVDNLGYLRMTKCSLYLKDVIFTDVPGGHTCIGTCKYIFVSMIKLLKAVKMFS